MKPWYLAVMCDVTYGITICLALHLALLCYAMLCHVRGWAGLGWAGLGWADCMCFFGELCPKTHLRLIARGRY